MDTWATLGPAALSLVGVGLGAAGSLLGQHLTSRATARQLEAQQSAEHRAEVKEVIMHFLSVALRVEKGATEAPEPAEEARDGLIDQLWLAQAGLDLAARTEELRGAAYRYAAHLTELVRTGERPLGQTLKSQFMDAAYADLWPGQHRDPAA